MGVLEPRMVKCELYGSTLQGSKTAGLIVNTNSLQGLLRYDLVIMSGYELVLVWQK